MFISNVQLLDRNLEEFLLHYTSGGIAQLNIKCHNHHITVQLQAEIGPHFLGRNLPPRPRSRRPPPGFENRKGHYPPKPPKPKPKPKPLPPQTQTQNRKVIMDLGARPREPFDAVGRDLHNTHILDASLKTLALAPLEQIDGASTLSGENAVPPKEATTVTEGTEEEEYWRNFFIRTRDYHKQLELQATLDDTAFPFPPTAACAQLEDETAHSECKPPSTSAGDDEQDFEKQGDSETDWYSECDNESMIHLDSSSSELRLRRETRNLENMTKEELLVILEKVLLEERTQLILKEWKTKPRGRLK